MEIFPCSTPNPLPGSPGRGGFMRGALSIHGVGPAFSDGGRLMQALWTKCLARVREEVSPQAFERWFSATHPVGQEGGSLTVEAPDPFSLDTLRTRYSGLLEAILAEGA